MLKPTFAQLKMIPMIPQKLHLAPIDNTTNWGSLGLTRFSLPPLLRARVSPTTIRLLPVSAAGVEVGAAPGLLGMRPKLLEVLNAVLAIILLVHHLSHLAEVMPVWPRNLVGNTANHVEHLTCYSNPPGWRHRYGRLCGEEDNQ